MSFTSRSPLINSNPRISFHFTNPQLTHLKVPRFTLSIPSHYYLTNPPILQTQNLKPINSNAFDSIRAGRWSLRAFEPEGSARRPEALVESFLPVCELLILFPLAVVSVGIAVNSSLQRPIVAWLGTKVHAWNFALLANAALVGYLVRVWQWRRMCASFSRGGDSGVDLLQRVGKLEEDVRSTATIVRVLSRQLEKLGIRFRVTRKTLKDPIAETAALAQKNSEATRALAVQEDMLEKELGEIQQVLLAMQEQQQKQLELIIAISKVGKLLESRRENGHDPEKNETRNLAEKGLNQIETNQIETLAGHKESSNDRV